MTTRKRRDHWEEYYAAQGDPELASLRALMLAFVSVGAVSLVAWAVTV